jgi:D-alanine transaminase
MKVFFNGKIDNLDNIKLSPFDRGFLYADGVYEVIRTYNGKFFRLEDHLERLIYSSNSIKINFKEIDKIENILYQLINENKFASAVMAYIQITRGTYFPRKHSFPEQNINPTVFISVNPLSEDRTENETGIKVILQKDVRWQRCDIKSVSLLPNVLANQQAKGESAGEAVWVNKGFLLEGSHTNFFGVKNGEVWTAPLSNLILSGVTRKVILELCNSLNIQYKEQAIGENEIKSFDEFFISGTTTEIKPVIQINKMKIQNGKPGKLTKRLQTAFYDFVKINF